MREGAGNDGRPRILGAFPAIGCEHLHCYPSDTNSLQEWLAEHNPHWIVHFDAVPSESLDLPPWFKKNLVERLARHLGLSCEYRLRPRESGPRLRSGESSSLRPVYLVRLDSDSTSYALAVAAALTAASAGRPLPPWLLLSGALADNPGPDLPFHFTTQIAEKIKLAAGEETLFDVRPLLDRIWHEADHDPKEERVKSGEVKLFVIPTHASPWTEEVEKCLPVAPLAVRLEDLRAADFGQLEKRVDALAQGGMVVVQVPTVWHALHLLGFEIAEDRVASGGDVRVYRVGGLLERTPEARQRSRTQQVDLWLRDVKSKRDREVDAHARLEIILEAIRAKLKADAAYIAEPYHESKNWLKVVAGKRRDNGVILPQWMPANVGFDAQVLRTGRRLVLKNREKYNDFLRELVTPDILPPLITSGEVSRAEFYRERRDRNPDREPSISSGDVSPWEPTDELNGSNVPAEPPPSPRSISLYSPGDSSRYWSLFLGIQVCMTFPLKASDRLLGVLCLYWNEDRKPRADCTADEETTCDCVDCALLEEAAKLASEDVAKGHQPGGNTVSVADGAGLAAGPASAEEALTRLNFLPELEAIELGNAPPDLSPLSLTTLRNAETVKRWLVDVGRALEVGRASLFVRDRTNGHYVPLLEPDENAADCHYAPGEGGTGLVIKQRRALLINDCGDPRELAQLGIREFKYDLRIWDRDKDKLAFLAVPIFVGEDVLGVLRFLRLTPRNAPAPNDGPPFTEIHQKLAEAAAERLARWLYKLQEHRDAHIRKTLPSSIFQSLDRIEVCENLHQALEWRIGPCRCLVRLRDKRERGDGNLEEVLDRWFVSDHSDSLWPQYRTRDDPDSGLVWREGRTQVIADVPAERQRRIDNGQQPDQWMNEAGCAVIVSMSLTKASPFRSVTYSTNFYREMVGILAVIRDNPHSFLPSDIKFVEQMAELAGPAFVKLAQTEEDHIQDSLNCALINYFFNRLKKMPPHAASAQLLLEINTALTLGVGGAVGYVWRVEDTSGKLLRGLEPADAPAPQDVPWAALQQELGDRHFLVVSDIDGDKRLKCLLDALPNKQGARYQNCQRACILLDRTEHLRILHPALFFLVVLPPQRLSYERVEHLFRNLITTVIYRD